MKRLPAWIQRVFYYMARGISLEKRKVIYNKYKGKCAYCGCKLDRLKFHIDHITPKFRGSTHEEVQKYGRVKGSNDVENLNPACISCNCSKSTFTIEQWRIELSLKLERTRRDVSSFRIMERFGIVKVSNKDIVFYFEKTK